LLYEFYCSNDANEDGAPEAFIYVLYKKLKDMKLETLLGLHLLHRGEDLVAVESMVDSVRANVLILKEKFDEIDRDETVNVIWAF